VFGFFEALYTLIQRKSAIKSVQSGTTAGAGNITINAVNTSKTVVLSKSKGSAGTVAATGSVTVGYWTNYYSVTYGQGYTDYPVSGSGSTSYRYIGPTLTGSISGGSTDLTTKQYSAKLTASNNIYCDGPVEWQVIEFA
jgi:hypothetical protein